MKIIRSTTHCTSLVLNISHINPVKNRHIELKFLKYVYQCKITPFSSILKEKLLILLKMMFRSSIVVWFRNSNLVSIKTIMGFPGSSVGKESYYSLGLLKNPILLQCRRPWFNSWVGKIPWRRGRLPTSILAWRIPWTIQSMGSQRVGHDWGTFSFTFKDYSKCC